MEAGRESKEYFSMASESEGLFKLMEHKGDRVTPLRPPAVAHTCSATSSGVCMMPPLADESSFWLSGWHQN